MFGAKIFFFPKLLFLLFFFEQNSCNFGKIKMKYKPKHRVFFSLCCHSAKSCFSHVSCVFVWIFPENGFSSFHFPLIIIKLLFYFCIKNISNICLAISFNMLKIGFGVRNVWGLRKGGSGSSYVSFYCIYFCGCLKLSSTTNDLTN